MNTISTGIIPNPYREFIYNIQPGKTENIKYDHSISEVLDCNLPDNIEVCYGYSGGFTPVRPGVSYKYPNNKIVPNIQFKNTSKTELMTIRLYLAIGDVVDNRLQVSGTLTVQSTPTKPVYVNDSLMTTVDVKTLIIDENGMANYTPPAGAKKVLIQNTGASSIVVLGGFVIAPLGVFDLNYAGMINFTGSAKNTIVVGAFS